MNVFGNLFSSTKWLVVIVAIVGVTVVAGMGHITGQEYVVALVGLVGIGSFSRAIEKLAKK
jgi:hypothetical protein